MLLRRGRPQLGQPSYLGLQRRVVELGEWPPTPQGQCLGVPVRIGPGRGELVGEGRDVDRGAVCHELIPVDRGDDTRPGRKHPAQPGDRRVQRACGIAGGTFPHQLTEQVGAHHLTGVRGQRDEQPPLLRGADEHGACRADDQQRPEHAHHRHPNMVTVPRRRGHRITQARAWDGAADRPRSPGPSRPVRLMVITSLSNGEHGLRLAPHRPQRRAPGHGQHLAVTRKPWRW